MLSKKFQSVITEIKQSNYAYAKKILDEIDFNSIGDSSQDLYTALRNKIPFDFDSRDVVLDTVKSNALSDLDFMEIKPGVSIVSCCMNRNENLLKSLMSWIKLPVNEIIIVDWSSNVPVIETINEIILADSRIKVLRVEGAQKWVLTYGFNVGLRFASYSKVYKFDADIKVSHDFLELNDIKSNQFVRGYWKSALDQGLNDQVYVNGSFGAHKKHLRQIGYYNELIRTYGWDDSDLYERLAGQAGLETKFLNFNSVVHLDQSEADRTSNQEVINNNLLGKIKPTEFNNQRNKFIGRTTDYWDISRLQDYHITPDGPQIYKLHRFTQPIDLPDYLIDDANIYAVAHFLWGHHSSMIMKSKDHKIFSKLIFEEFKFGISFDLTKKMLGEDKRNSEAIFFNSEYLSFDDFVKHSIEIAKEKNTPIFAISYGDNYCHKRIGEYPALVDIVNLPLDFLENVLHFRATNGSPKVEVNTLNKIESSEFLNVVSGYFNLKVYVDAQHGLGNRLRAIGSAAAIAKSFGRELVIVWQADHHCECEFSDLFDYEGKVINKAFVGNAYQYMDVFNYMEIEEGACKDAEVIVDNEKDLYLRAAYTFAHEASYWEVENEFIKALTPSKQVLDLISSFNVDGYIAAHIRMEAGVGLDKNTYDSVENWTQEGHDQLHFWREKSHYSAFIKRIDQLISENNGVKVFVATDLQETYDIFQKYYGERLVYLKRNVFDRSKEQIIYALADVLLLSQCQKLLGSTWSSFSEAAMRLSDTYSEIEMSGKDF